MYRTGDLARWRADGCLEVLGRVDHQVKLRGFRIELGEIEVILAGTAQVQQAAVVVRADEPGMERLVAYVVLEPETPPDSLDLRRYVKEQLPEYMIPSAFVILDGLPLTPSGKVDRRALPAPDNSQRVRPPKFVAPRSPVEELLAGIWTRVLSVEQVGIEDNFFELGGHSLLATRVISQVRDALAIELPVRSLFEGPTVAELGAHIEGFSSREPAESIPILARAPRDSVLPLSFAQERLWFFDQLEPASAVYNIPYILRLRGGFVPALERSLREIVRRHEALRTGFASVNGQPALVVHDGATFGLTVTDLRSLPEAERGAEAQRLWIREASRHSTCRET